MALRKQLLDDLQMLLEVNALGPYRLRQFEAKQKFRSEFAFFAREKWPEFRRKMDLYEPLLTAVAQVLASLTKAWFCWMFLDPQNRNEVTKNATMDPSERKKAHKFFSHKLSVPPFGPGFAGLPLCKIRRKPGFVPAFHRICPRDKPGEIPGTNPGLSQDRPDKNIYVYVPFSCLRPKSRPSKWTRRVWVANCR